MYFLLRNEGWSVLPTPRSSQPFKTVCSPIQAVFSCHIITLVFFTLQDLSILLSPSFSYCLNPSLARPEAPFLCHENFSRQGDVFPCHHVLHFLQLPRCFLQGILLHPLPDLACWKWPCWVWCEPFFHHSFTLWSHYCKNKFAISRLFPLNMT